MDLTFNPGKVDPGREIFKFGLLLHAGLIAEAVLDRFQQIVLCGLGMGVACVQYGREIPGFAIGAVGHFIQFYKMPGFFILADIDEMIAY
jgi:hypothetical protein